MIELIFSFSVMHSHFETQKKRKKFTKVYPKILKPTDFLVCCTCVGFVVELKPCRMEMVALLCVGSKDINPLQGLSARISVSMGKHKWY